MTSGMTSGTENSSPLTTATASHSNQSPISVSTPSQDQSQIPNQALHSRQASLRASITTTINQKPNSTNKEETEHTALPSNASTATAVPNEPQHTKPPLPTLLCFAALTLSIFLVALDTVLIPTALPTIALSFHIPDSLYAWTGSAYLLANAASVPFWGKLSDVFGRRNIILIADTIFLAGSLLCAVSVSAGMLVGGRAVQGLGGGGVVVLVYVCVADMFAIRDRSFYLGIVGAVWALASALGPVLGGIFAQNLNWRWCFYVNLPIVSVSTITLYFTLHLHDPRTCILPGLKSIDWAGTCTILMATLFFLIGLQFGGTSSYSTPLVISFLTIGTLSYFLFPWTQHITEKHGGAPIMPLRIFKDISNLSALGVCACDALVFNSVAYFLPLYFQLVLAKSPSTAGLYMLAIAIPLALVSFLAGYAMEKTGRFLEILQSGLALMTIGVGLLTSFTPSLDLGKIIGFLVVIGLGFGPNFHAPLIALQTRIQDQDIASGVAAFGFVRMVSGAIGVVVGQVVLQILMRSHASEFLEAGISSGFAEQLAGGEAISEAFAVAGLPRGQRDVVRSGLTVALRGTWIFYTVISAMGLLISFGIKRTTLQREAAIDKGKEVSVGVNRVADEEMGGVEETATKKQ